MRPHTCGICGARDESKFVYSGPHIKQICNSCGKYVKFVGKSTIPDAGEVRLRIWSITQDVDYIDVAKGSSGFIEGLTGIDKNIVYWRLYLEIRKMEAVS
ncbi:hypothetical protein [Pedobacter agri]|uniref:Uncharacterized protein n=1 Tax=Pedobacter agri TaxID=454586 RepID=A0A9X3DFL1_9SPHI|nr:hypothetical protein [Pedobacter agri]MCX3266574.1 hypothetical protein [Pedobacter agri]